MGRWCVVFKDHLELETWHAEVQGCWEGTVSLGVFPEQHIDTDPEILGIDAVVDEFDQPGGREDRPGSVRLVSPREDQSDVAVVDYREGDLSAKRSTDLGEAQGEEVIFLGPILGGHGIDDPNTPDPREGVTDGRGIGRDCTPVGPVQQIDQVL